MYLLILCCYNNFPNVRLNTVDVLPFQNMLHNEKKSIIDNIQDEEWNPLPASFYQKDSPRKQHSFVLNTAVPFVLLVLPPLANKWSLLRLISVSANGNDNSHKKRKNEKEVEKCSGVNDQLSGLRTFFDLLGKRELKTWMKLFVPETLSKDRQWTMRWSSRRHCGSSAITHRLVFVRWRFVH